MKYHKLESKERSTCNIENNPFDSSSSDEEDNTSGFHCIKLKEPNDFENSRKILIAIIVCTIFMLIEGIGGYLAGSLAICSDAAHLLSDLAGFMISYFAIIISKRPATKKYSFGFFRAEIIGALLSTVLIWVLTLYLVVESFSRINDPQPIRSRLMIVISILGIIVNIIIALTLHETGHGHSHRHKQRHSSHVTEHDLENLISPIRLKEPRKDLNIRAAYIHAVGDFIQSIGVFFASILIWIKPNWTIADPICTLFFSVIVIFTTSRLFKDILNILMEATPSHLDPSTLISELLTIPGVTDVHDLHVWSISSGRMALIVHIVINDPINYKLTLLRAQQLLCENYDIHHTTIQIDLLKSDSDHCTPESCQVK